MRVGIVGFDRHVCDECVSYQWATHTIQTCYGILRLCDRHARRLGQWMAAGLGEQGPEVVPDLELIDIQYVVITQAHGRSAESSYETLERATAVLKSFTNCGQWCHSPGPHDGNLYLRAKTGYGPIEIKLI